jgi:putative thiamine transport system ATP-binding protein
MTLELRDVSILLHGQALVPALNAQVAPGEVLAVMGESGSGKSSLLAFLAGLLAPPLEASGKVWLDGRDITTLPTEARRVGLLFQDDLLFPHMSVLHNLLFALPAAGARAIRSERVAAAEQALQRAGLAGYGARLPGSLSGGQRARVSLLRTLLSQPRVLLLDEPFSKLDAALRSRMRAFVWAELRAQQVSGVLVTHDRQDVPPYAQLIELPPLPARAGDA